jgi:hypothetical protein
MSTRRVAAQRAVHAVAEVAAPLRRQAHAEALSHCAEEGSSMPGAQYNRRPEPAASAVASVCSTSLACKPRPPSAPAGHEARLDAPGSGARAKTIEDGSGPLA